MDLRKEFRRRLDEMTRPWRDNIVQTVLPQDEYAKLVCRMQGVEQAFAEFEKIYLAGIREGDLDI